MLNGRSLFPNATIHVPRKDADFWLDDRNRAKVDDLLKPFFPAVQGVLAPYRRAGKVSVSDGGAALLPDLTPIAAPGHTPGHTVYLLQDGGQSLLFWGDTVHMAPVQFPHPEIAIRYDWNVPMAVASRERLLARAVAESWLLAGAHISFPGVGHVRPRAGGGYDWVPVNYSLNRTDR